MFNLEKREKFIILVLLVILLAGIIFGLYQKRVVYVDAKPDNLIYSAQEPISEKLKININESDAAGIMKLKGVGSVVAGRIIEYRQVSGRFLSVEDLKKVKGIGPKLYEKIKGEVSVE
jgi:comEA protein